MVFSTRRHTELGLDFFWDRRFTQMSADLTGLCFDGFDEAVCLLILFLFR